VTVKYNSPIDARHTVNDLLGEGYSAVFIAAGAQSSRRIGIVGEDEELEGLYYGLQFLSDIGSGKKIELKGKVLVVGGGNVAVDVARTALRTGAEDVQIFYRRTRERMPAWEKDIEEALEEGIVLNTLWAPKRILQADGRVTGMEFVRSIIDHDEEGRAVLSVDEDTTRAVEAESVIISVGQAPDVSFLDKDSQLERALWGSLAVEENTLATNIAGIFAGGDFTTGPSTVIQAIASGRRAALAIDRYLRREAGALRIRDEKSAKHQDAGLALDEESPEEKFRVRIEIENPRDRARDFREVEKGFKAEEARYEAGRCLRCDLERDRR
jgi:NADH-quinone oxidoreductase subunit F